MVQSKKAKSAMNISWNETIKLGNVRSETCKHVFEKEISTLDARAKIEYQASLDGILNMAKIIHTTVTAGIIDRAGNIDTHIRMLTIMLTN